MLTIIQSIFRQAAKDGKITGAEAMALYAATEHGLFNCDEDVFVEQYGKTSQRICKEILADSLGFQLTEDDLK